MHRLQEIEEGVLVSNLRRARDIALAIFQRRRRIARRPQQCRQRIAPQPSAGRDAVLDLVVGAFARGVPEVAQVEREGAVVLQLDDLLHRLDVARLAIRRETHHLVFVAVVRKADELRHRLVEHAERMGKVDAAVDGDRTALAQPPGGGGKIAEAIDRNRHGLVVRRHQEGRGQVAEMVLDGMHGAAEFLLRQVPPQVAGDVGAIAALAQAIQHVARADARGQHIGKLAPAVGAIVAVDRDMLDVAQRDAGFGQAVADRFAGEAAPMLDAAEALFLDGGDQGAILHQAGGRVGVISVQPQDVSHQDALTGLRRSRSRRSRCMERIRSAVTRWAV